MSTHTAHTAPAGSAVFVPAAQGRPYWIPEEPPADLVDGDGPEMSKYTFMATRDQTSGELTVIDTEVPPGNGPPEHRHGDADEAFYGLEGEFWFRAGGQEFVLGPRDFAFVRRGTDHVWKNNTDRTARMLRMYTPAGHEEFFFRIGIPANTNGVFGEEAAAPRLTRAIADNAEAVATATYGPREPE
jgi:quercetin dioxygenase-like cupin family protein